MLKYLTIVVAFLCTVQGSASNVSNSTKVSSAAAASVRQLGLLGRMNSIPDGYLPSPAIGAAHKLQIWRLSWNKARRACYDEGGHLAIINSQTERYILLDIMSQYGVGSIWVGLHDLFEKDDWNTVDGVPLSATGYMGWLPGEPNNSGGNEHCVEFRKAGSGFNDLDCGVQLPFFCEVAL